MGDDLKLLDLGLKSRCILLHSVQVCSHAREGRWHLLQFLPFLFEALHLLSRITARRHLVSKRILDSLLFDVFLFLELLFVLDL